jgi:predicted RNA binding protein YcfA (HicA-like mRNA interferase family)
MRKMTASELVKLIEKRGWKFEREGKGSHKNL